MKKEKIVKFKLISLKLIVLSIILGSSIYPIYGEEKISNQGQVKLNLTKEEIKEKMTGRWKKGYQLGFTRGYKRVMACLNSGGDIDSLKCLSIPIHDFVNGTSKNSNNYFLEAKELSEEEKEERLTSEWKEGYQIGINEGKKRGDLCSNPRTVDSCLIPRFVKIYEDEE
jgi:hypothetical protein